MNATTAQLAASSTVTSPTSPSSQHPDYHGVTKSRNLVFVVRPRIARDLDDPERASPAYKRRMRVGADAKAIPLSGDFNVRRITPQEVEDHFSEETLRNKHKARGASKKLIELLAAGTDLPRRRTAADSAAGASSSSGGSRLPTSILELQRQSEAAAAAAAAAATPTLGGGGGSGSMQPLSPLQLEGHDPASPGAGGGGGGAGDSSASFDQASASGGASAAASASASASAAVRLNASLEASLAEYDRPAEGMVAIRCAPTANKNFFRESYAHDYAAVAATNATSVPEHALNPPCAGVEKSVLDLYKKHLIGHCKCLWDGEDATVVLQSAAESASNAGAVQPAPSQLMATLLFPEVPNAKEEQLDDLSSGLSGRRGSMSRRGSMRASSLSRRGSMRRTLSAANLAELAQFTTQQPQQQQQQGGGGGGGGGSIVGRGQTPEHGLDETFGTMNLNGTMTLPAPAFPNEKHLLRYLLQDLLKEKKERDFKGVQTDVFVSAVIVEEPDEDAIARKLETNSAASFFSQKSAVKISVEDLLGGHPRTARYIGDWAGSVKDLEAVHAAAQQQMQALPNAPSIEQQREECKVLQMLRALDDNDAEQLIEEFKKFDQDGNGVLDPTEIREFFMEAFGYWIVDDELEQFFKVADQDNSGSIDIPEFLALFEGQRASRPKRGPGERSLKLPNSKLVEGLKALARIKRVKKADELSMRTGGGGGGASASATGQQPPPAAAAAATPKKAEGKILQMLHALDDHDADKLISEFKKFDADGNSELDRTEVREFFMEAFSYWVTEEEMDRFFAVADTDNSGTIDIPEFLALFEHKRDKRAFTGAKPSSGGGGGGGGGGGSSLVSAKLASGLDALAKIKRVRKQALTLKAAATAIAKLGGGSSAQRGRSGSLTSIGGDLARRPSSLLGGPKIAYRHANSTNPFDIGVYNMRMLHVTGDDDIEWLERRLATMLQKAFYGGEDFSQLKCKGHWIVNITLRQAYDEQCGLGLPSRAGTMRFLLLNASQKRMTQLNYELRRMLHSVPRSIYDKFPPDVDAQMQLDSLDSRGRMRKSVLNMVHLLRAALHQKKISRMVGFVVSAEGAQVNASLGVLGQLMRTGIETTNLAYDRAVEEALVHLVALRMQLERERNDAHFAVAAFEEVKKAKAQANKDITVEIQKQTNTVYRQLRRVEQAQEALRREEEKARHGSFSGGDAGAEFQRAGSFAQSSFSGAIPGMLSPTTFLDGGRQRSVIFLSSPMSPRSSRHTSPTKSAFEGASSPKKNSIPNGSFTSNSNINDSFGASGTFGSGTAPTNREIGLTSALEAMRDKAEKNEQVRQQQLRDAAAVQKRARDRHARARASVENLRMELPRKQAHYEFLLQNSDAEWVSEVDRLEQSKKEQMRRWADANVEQRDARFALSVLPEVPDEEAVLESVHRQADTHRRRGFENQLRKCAEMRAHHEAHLAAARASLQKLQKVADAISGRGSSADAADAWEDSMTPESSRVSPSPSPSQQHPDGIGHDQSHLTMSGAFSLDDHLASPQQQPQPQQRQHDDDDDLNELIASRKKRQRALDRRRAHHEQRRGAAGAALVPANLKPIMYAKRRAMFGECAVLFEAASLLFRVLETNRTQNSEMVQKFDRGDFHEAPVREANRHLTVQPPQAMLAALLPDQPACLQAVIRDAVNGAHAALHQLGSTFGRNAALHHADSLKAQESQQQQQQQQQQQHQQQQQQQDAVPVSVAPLQMTPRMHRALSLVARVRNDPSVRMSLSDVDVENLERMTFVPSGGGGGGGGGGGDQQQQHLVSTPRGQLQPRRPATARIKSGGGVTTPRRSQQPRGASSVTARQPTTTANKVTGWLRQVTPASQKPIG